MATSSARPPALAAFPAGTAPVADALRRARTTGLDVLDAFVAGAGEVPVRLDPEAQLAYLDDCRREVEHLAGWVADVGRAFREAGGDPDGDGIVTAEDTPLSKLVGEPSIGEAEAAAQGQADARELQAALRDLGIDPEDFDPQDLQFLDPGDDRYHAVFELIEDHGDAMWSDDYSAAYFDVLGPEGMCATIGMIDEFASTKGNTGLVGPDTDWMGDVDERLLVPFANGWARASGSVDLEEEREALLTPDTWWEHRQLALLMAGNGSEYDPRWLADAAEVVLVAGADDAVAMFDDPMASGAGAPYDSEDWYPGLGLGQYLYDDRELGYPGLVALRALGDSTEAANLFAQGGEENLDVLVHPDSHVWLSPVTQDAEELQARLHEVAADVVEEGFLVAPYELPVDPTAQLRAYDTFVRLVGEGDVPDPVKVAAARTLLPYLPEIGRVAEEGYIGAVGPDDALFDRPDLVAFFAELGYDPDASAVAAAQLGAWGQAGLQDVPPGELGEGDAVMTHLRQMMLLTDVASDGLLANADDRDAAAKAFWGGVARGTAFVLSTGAAAIPVLVGGPVGAPVSLAIAGGSGIVNFALGTAGAEAEGSVPDVDANDLTRELTRTWRQDLIARLVDEGVIDGDLSPSRQLNELVRLMGGEDEFEEIRQSVEGRSYDRDDDW
jgi:hypothetical protein